MSAPATDFLGQTVAEGRFVVSGWLRAGGMARIFLGKEIATGQPVIIKVPHRALIQADPNWKQRFIREILTLRQLAHPHVVPVLHAGEQGGLPFLVLRYLDGGTLFDRMHTAPDRGQEPQPGRTLKTWLPQVAQALDFIHGQSYVHRDVKPENILFDRAGAAYLGDFGILRGLSADAGAASLTRLGDRPLGTPPYMAPEQIKQLPLGPTTDQFALAVVVYEWLAGRRPFPGATLEQIAQAHLQPPPALHLVCPDLEPEAHRVVAQALSPRPAERFPTCQVFVSHLLAALESQPAAAGPAPEDEDSARGPMTWSIPLPDFDEAPPHLDAAPAPQYQPPLPQPVPTPQFGPATPQFGPATPQSAGPAPQYAVMTPQPSPTGQPPFGTPPPSAVGGPPEPMISFFPQPVAVPQAGGMYLVPPPPARGGSVVLTLLKWTFLLVIFVAGVLAGSFFLPGTRVQRLVGKPLSPLLVKLKAPGWVAGPSLPAASETAGPDLEGRARDLEKEKATLTRRLADVELRLRESDRGHQLTRRDKEELAKKLALAETRLVEEASRKQFADRQRELAVEQAKKAEERAREAERKAGQGNEGAAALKAKLDVVERTFKETKLWFVLQNPNNSPVSFETRVQAWDGTWSDWQKHKIERKTKMKFESTPGTIWVQMRYDYTLNDGKIVYESKNVNPQLFFSLETPAWEAIHPVFAFQYNRNATEVHLVRMDR